MHDGHRSSIFSFRCAGSLAAIALGSFLGAHVAVAQVTIGGVTSAADLAEPVPGDCANYDSVLSTAGVTVNGVTHPGRCRSTVFTPLFDGSPLGNSMQAFLINHRNLFQSQTKVGKGGYCATTTRLNVSLSASLQATRLQWTGAPTVGAKCTNEVMRVNAVSAPSAAISPYTQALVSRMLQAAAKKLMSSSEVRGCGRGAKAAVLALDQQVWNLLQQIANDEIRWFDTSVAPAIDVGSACAAKCNLCFPGWVGQIRCTATVNDPSYQWNELQIWDVGGTPLPNTGSITEIPANFTATGDGSKQMGPSWTINATTIGTLTDSGVNANKRFSTSNLTVSNGIIYSTGLTNAEAEMQLKFNADQIGGNTATNDPMAVLPPCSNTQQKPGNIPCSVSCTWDLLLQ